MEDYEERFQTRMSILKQKKHFKTSHNIYTRSALEYLWHCLLSGDCAILHVFSPSRSKYEVVYSHYDPDEDDSIVVWRLVYEYGIAFENTFDTFLQLKVSRIFYSDEYIPLLSSMRRIQTSDLHYLAYCRDSRIDSFIQNDLSIKHWDHTRAIPVYKESDVKDECRELMTCFDEIKDTLSDGLYIKIANLLKSIWNK